MPPPELFSESPDGKPCNLITRENYEYLRDSFFRYASLMKKEAVHAPGLTMAEGITRLHDEMSDLVGNDMKHRAGWGKTHFPSLEMPQMGRTYAVLLPCEICGKSRAGTETHICHLHPQPDAGKRN